MQRTAGFSPAIAGSENGTLRHSPAGHASSPSRSVCSIDSCCYLSEGAMPAGSCTTESCVDTHRTGSLGCPLHGRATRVRTFDENDCCLIEKLIESHKVQLTPKEKALLHEIIVATEYVSPAVREDASALYSFLRKKGIDMEEVCQLSASLAQIEASTVKVEHGNKVSATNKVTTKTPCGFYRSSVFGDELSSSSSNGLLQSLATIGRYHWESEDGPHYCPAHSGASCCQQLENCPPRHLHGDNDKECLPQWTFDKTIRFPACGSEGTHRCTKTRPVAGYDAPRSPHASTALEDSKHRRELCHRTAVLSTEARPLAKPQTPPFLERNNAGEMMTDNGARDALYHRKYPSSNQWNLQEYLRPSEVSVDPGWPNYHKIGLQRLYEWDEESADRRRMTTKIIWRSW